MTEWLIRAEVLPELRQKLAIQATAEQIARYEAAEQSTDRAPRSLSVDTAAGVATISVRGPLMARAGFWTWLLDGTGYDDLGRALATASADPSVRRIRWDIDSPGGEVAGLFDLIDAIERAAKPMTVSAACATSAAYALAAVAGPISATGPAAMFGSIGVAASIYMNDRVVDIASTAAPKKRPDVRTEKGREVVRELLDQIHGLFVGAIARGRHVTPKSVNSDFGQGGVFLAERALKAGMIDSILGGTVPSKGKAMTPEQLKAAHPATYAAVVEIGRAEERERVTAFLDVGEMAGELGRKQAREAIRAGEALSPARLVAFHALALNKRDQDDYEADSAEAEQATANAAKTGATRDLGDILADNLAAPQLSD